MAISERSYWGRCEELAVVRVRWVELVEKCGRSLLGWGDVGGVSGGDGKMEWDEVG